MCVPQEKIFELRKCARNIRMLLSFYLQMCIDGMTISGNNLPACQIFDAIFGHKSLCG